MIVTPEGDAGDFRWRVCSGVRGCASLSRHPPPEELQTFFIHLNLLL